MSHGHKEYTAIDLATYLKGASRKSWVDVGDDRWHNLGEGWLPVERSVGNSQVTYRRTRAVAVAYLWNPYGSGSLHIQASGASPCTETTTGIEVTINGTCGGRFNITPQKWTELVLPYSGTAGPLEVHIRAEDAEKSQKTQGQPERRGAAVWRLDYRPLHAATSAFLGMSVIIPTHNRIEKLLRVLLALESQTLDRRCFEVLVVDDGSTDSTGEELRRFMERSPLDIRYFRQENQLQGAARNRGIELARKAILVFLQDDIVPTSDFLEQHLAYHRQFNRHEDVAVVGYTTWPQGMRVTPFMRYVGERGPQFGYALIPDCGPISFSFFYTCNLSLPRSMVTKLEEVFAGDFDTYGWEDIELGYRLERQGMRLLYNPHARAHHHHSTSVATFCRRQWVVGKASRIFAAKHPDLASSLGDVDWLKRKLRRRGWRRIVEHTVHLLDRWLKVPFPKSVYNRILVQRFAEGAVDPAPLPEPRVFGNRQKRSLPMSR